MIENRKPTYQQILCELVLAALDLPTRVPDARNVRDWLYIHALIEDCETDTVGIIGTGLTVTGQNLLNQTSSYFQTMLTRLHETGQLEPKDTNGTQKDRDHDTHEQGHDGSKGKSAKKTKSNKDHAARYGRR